MDNCQRQSSITTTETLAKIKQAYKMKSDYIVRARIIACAVCFYNVWTLSIHYHVLQDIYVVVCAKTFVHVLSAVFS